jgi:Sap-like sulfolipid-1-addressing protein
LVVSGNSVELLAQLFAPAMVVAWSPLKVIPALVLVLHSARPKMTGFAFLLGSLAGLAATTAIFIAVPHLFDGLPDALSGGGQWPPFAIVVGAALIGYAGYRHLTRTRARPASDTWSRWTRIGPMGGLVLGLFLTVVNGKVMAMNAAAGVAIGAAAIGALGATFAVAYYTVIAGSTIIVPVLGYAVAAERVERGLDWTKQRMSRHQAMLTTIVVAVIGVVLVLVGLTAL